MCELSMQNAAHNSGSSSDYLTGSRGGFSSVGVELSRKHVLPK